MVLGLTEHFFFFLGIFIAWASSQNGSLRAVSLLYSVAAGSKTEYSSKHRTDSKSNRLMHTHTTDTHELQACPITEEGGEAGSAS